MPPASTTSPARLALIAVLALCGALNGVTLLWLLLRQPHFNADFLGFWSYPRFAPLAQIYDPQAMARFQQALYPGFKSFYPFTYPPDFLLVTGWMRDFSLGAARDIWTVTGLAAFLAAGLALFRGRPLPVVALLASPAALLSLVAGQTGFFAGALLLGGLAWLPSSPVLAGIAFGLLTLKPQMGLLLAVLLLARGEWRAIAAASLTALALAALSCALLPPELWRLWLHSLPQIQRDYFAGGVNLNVMITPAANLAHLGVPVRLLGATQGVCTLAVITVMALIARRAEYSLAVAALLAGTFLAQPHAYAYDAVTLPAAFALCAPPRPAPWQLALAAAVYLSPLLLLTPADGWFLYAPLLAVLFGAIAAAPRANSLLTRRGESQT